MSILQRRFLARSRWPQATVTHYAETEIDVPLCRGMAALCRLRVDGMPVMARDRLGNPLQIVGDGYLWLQLAPADAAWWLTAMYDAQARFVQFYIDITLENHILPGGQSWNIDGFLDIVIDADGETRLLDREELVRALDDGTITRAQYDFLSAQAEQILNVFPAQKDSLLALCTEYLHTLLST